MLFLLGVLMRIVFFGKEWRILDALRNCPVKIMGVYLPEAIQREYQSRPLAKKVMMRLFECRMRRVDTYLPLAEYLRQNPLPIIKSAYGSKAMLRELARMRLDMGIVARFEQILREEMFSLPKHGFVNFHPSMLPKYRGPDPWHHILLNKETVSGTTWHQVADNVDAGDIVVQSPFGVEPKETVKSLYEKSVTVACDLLPSVFINFSKPQPKTFRQNDSLATSFKYAGKEQLAELKRMKKL